MTGGLQQFARVLESLQPKPSEAMHWLQNAGRVIAANSERWADEDAENERLDAAEYEQWLDERNGDDCNYR